jgi:tRNA(Ile)-lysidine synthase
VANLAPPVAATRTAIRRALRGLPPGLALVACSGGPDSLALAAACGFVAPRLGWRAGLMTVDHRLQAGSAERAEAVAGWARKHGFDPVEVLRVEVAGRPGGPVVLLGHTRDDQAETVLLALARGAGPRGLAGMPALREYDGVVWLRPLLDLSRAAVREACAEQGLAPWHDPHNTDLSYARARVRATALPALVEALGPRVVDNLARTARQLAVDTAALDGLAAAGLAAARTPDGLAIPAIRDLPDAIRTRVLHAWARDLGVPGSALSHRHVAALDALVSEWHGQGPVALPGGIRVRRRAAVLTSG